MALLVDEVSIGIAVGDFRDPAMSYAWRDANPVLDDLTFSHWRVGPLDDFEFERARRHGVQVAWIAEKGPNLVYGLGDELGSFELTHGSSRS